MGVGWKIFEVLKKMTRVISSHSRGGSSSHHPPEPMPSPITMYYEQDKQVEEQIEEPQAEDMEIDDDDAPYLDLLDDREH